MAGNAEATTTAAASTSGEVAWSWKRPKSRHLACNINGYIRLAVVNIIRKELQAAGGHDLVRRFKDSCFGHFLRPTWDTGVPGYSALHSLFTNEVIIPGASEDMFSFRVGNKLIHFSRQEYALVTGLRFGTTDFDINGRRAFTEDSVYTRYTTSVSGLGDRLRDDFKNGVFRDSADDALKVAKVLAAAYLVLGWDGQKKVPEQWLWRLVEDTERWEAFPWGSYSWDRLCHYIRDIPLELGGRKLYHVYGNLYAVLVWACEAIPDVLPALALEIAGAETMPRITRLVFRRVSGYDFTTFFDSERECRERLVPLPEEEVAVYLQHLDVPLPLCARYVHVIAPCKRTRAREDTRAAVDDDDDDDYDDDDGVIQPAHKRVRTRGVRHGTQGRVGEEPVRGVREVIQGNVREIGSVGGRVDRERIDPRNDPLIEDDTCTRGAGPEHETRGEHHSLLHSISLMLTEERDRITREVRREGDRILQEGDRMWSEMRNEFNRMRAENRMLKEEILDELAKMREENRLLKEEIRREFRRFGRN